MTRSNALVRTLENGVMRIVMPGIRLRAHGKPPAREPAYPDVPGSDAPNAGATGAGPQSAGAYRVLICKWCCMGDAILSLYAIRAFKRAHPGVAVDVLVSSRIAEVYRRAPEIADVHVLPVTGRRLALELLHPGLWLRLASLLLKLRRKGYAQFIDLELYRGTGPVLKRLIGIRFSRGFQVEGALPKYHDFEAPRPRLAPEWHCFFAVMGLNIPDSPPEALYPAARSGTVPGAGRAPEPSASRSALPATGARIGIVPGSSFNWPQKKWPWEHFAETITLLAGDGHAFILFGSPSEKEESAKILGKARGKVTDTTGTLDYAGLQREVSLCDLVVGNDTGTLHLAAACGVPTVTLFGPTDPGKWNPLTSTPVFLETLACRPCYYLGSMPPCDHFSCLRKMAPALVAGRIREALALRTAAPVRAS